MAKTGMGYTDGPGGPSLDLRHGADKSHPDGRQTRLGPLAPQTRDDTRPPIYTRPSGLFQDGDLRAPERGALDGNTADARLTVASSLELLGVPVGTLVCSKSV